MFPSCVSPGRIRLVSLQLCTARCLVVGKPPILLSVCNDLWIFFGLRSAVGLNARLVIHTIPKKAACCMQLAAVDIAIRGRGKQFSLKLIIVIRQPPPPGCSFEHCPTVRALCCEKVRLFIVAITFCTAQAFSPPVFAMLGNCLRHRNMVGECIIDRR